MKNVQLKKIYLVYKFGSRVNSNVKTTVTHKLVMLVCRVSCYHGAMQNFVLWF